MRQFERSHIIDSQGFKAYVKELKECSRWRKEKLSDIITDESQRKVIVDFLDCLIEDLDRFQEIYTKEDIIRMVKERIYNLNSWSFK